MKKLKSKKRSEIAKKIWRKRSKRERKRIGQKALRTRMLNLA